MWSPLSTIAVIWFCAAIAPGPNFFMTVRMALTQSPRLALFTVAGIATGTIVWATSSYWGIQTLFVVAPWSYLTLKTAGGLYLGWLGAKLLWNSRDTKPSSSIASTRPLGPWKAYRLGLLTNIVNPKTAIFVAGIFAATGHADASLDEGVLAIALMAAISFG